MEKLQRVFLRGLLEKVLYINICILLLSLHCGTSPLSMRRDRPSSLLWKLDNNFQNKAIQTKVLDEPTHDIDRTDKFETADEIESESYLRRWEHIRERNKHQRLFLIQTQILERLGLPSKPNISSPFFSPEDKKQLLMMYDKMKTQDRSQQTPEYEFDEVAATTEPSLNDRQHNDLNIEKADVYAERVQSFYPSCNIPRHTDSEVWQNPEQFHVYYDLKTPTHMDTTNVEISSARLRLYKNRNNALTKSSEITDDAITVKTSANHDSVEADEEAESLRISVFQYLRPLRKSRKPKKKLIDSKIVPVSYEGWLEFDIQQTLKDWFDEMDRNLGLEIMVEDSHANLRNAVSFFKNMNCSYEKVDKSPLPFPYLLSVFNLNKPTEEPATTEPTLLSEPDTGSPLIDSGNVFEYKTYPMLDLRTVEYVPIPNKNTEGEVKTLQEDKESEDKRNRRHVVNSNCQRGNRNDCCQEKIYVDFREIGWSNWVIYPRGFQTVFCSRKCNDSESNQYISQHFNHNHRGHQNTDILKCKPSNFKPLPILYLDEDGEVHAHELDNFVAESCHCQPITT